MWRHSLSPSYLFPPGEGGSSDNSQLPSCELSPVSQCGSPLPRQRLRSEPWLAVHNPACLKKAHKEGTRKRSPHEEGDGNERGGREEEDERLHFHQSRLEEQRDSRVRRRDNRSRGGNSNSRYEDFCPTVSQSLLSLTEMDLSQATLTSLVPKKGSTPGGSSLDKVTPGSTKLPACQSPHSHLRRNTLPSVTIIPPPLHLPPLAHLQVPIQVLPSESGGPMFRPHPPSSAPPSSLCRTSARSALLPSLPLGSSAAFLVSPPAPCNKRSQRRHSAQLEHIRGGEDI